jgi:oligopeptide transport system permease protein
MVRYFALRVVTAVPTLLAIVTLAFFLMRIAPGGPFDEDQALPPAIKANLDAAYGLDQPLPVQFGRYLSGLLRGDFGPSLKYRDFSVTDLVVQGLPVSLTLGAIAMLLAAVLGIGGGILAALYRGSWLDHWSLALCMVGIVVPTFVVLPFLALVFGLHLKWLPVAGWEPGAAKYFVLPVIALALPPMGYIARLMRASMISVLDTPYVRTAHAKGLPLRTVILRHALKPALIPVVGFLAPAAAAVLSGSLVVESIAGLPGVGRYLVQGALNRDYTLVLGMVVIYSSLLIALGLVVDLIYVWLDPRLRF